MSTSTTTIKKGLVALGLTVLLIACGDDGGGDAQRERCLVDYVKRAYTWEELDRAMAADEMTERDRQVWADAQERCGTT